MTCLLAARPTPLLAARRAGCRARGRVLERAVSCCKLRRAPPAPVGRQGAGALRAGDGQCGAVPAAAEAAWCRAGGPLLPAGDSARLTPCSSAVSSFSALRLRPGGMSEDAGLAGRAPPRAPPPATPTHSLAALLARGRLAAPTAPAAMQQRRASPGVRACSLRVPSIWLALWACVQ